MKANYYQEWLVAMEPGSSLRVLRYGDLYGEPAERIAYWDGEDLLIENPPKAA